MRPSPVVRPLDLDADGKDVGQHSFVAEAPARHASLFLWAAQPVEEPLALTSRTPQETLTGSWYLI